MAFFLMTPVPANSATPTSKGQRIGYVRVSSADQNTARQLDSQRIEESVSKARVARDLRVSRDAVCRAPFFPAFGLVLVKRHLRQTVQAFRLGSVR